MKNRLLPCALVLTCCQVPAADWSLLSRNFFLNNDFRTPGPGGQSLRREWAQGFIGNFSSDLTPGNIGLGFDLHGFLGLKLDGGRGHAGTGLLPVDSDGRSERDYSDAGGALRLVHGQTSLAWGEMTVETPVFDTGDKRLQPEYATGWFLDDRSLPGLRLQAGRFTAFKNQDSSASHDEFEGYGASTGFGGLSLAGATWKAADTRWGGALYASQLDEMWRQVYANLNGHFGSWSLDANLYKTHDTGSTRAGDIDTLAWSVLGKVTLASHALSLSYQKIDGDTPFDFVGGDSIYLANSIKYADFNGPGEHSWQARYQWSGASVGLAGLTLSARYVRGSGIDGRHAPCGGAYNPLEGGVCQPAYGDGGRHWERDFDLRYVVQAGPAKDLAVSFSQVSHRANDAQGGADIDRIYVIVEYPLKGVF